MPTALRDTSTAAVWLSGVLRYPGSTYPRRNSSTNFFMALTGPESVQETVPALLAAFQWML